MPDQRKPTEQEIIRASKRENLSGFSNNKGADQPVHLSRLISSFVIHFLEIIISKPATSEISIYQSP